MENEKSDVILFGGAAIVEWAKYGSVELVLCNIAVLVRDKDAICSNT